MNTLYAIPIASLIGALAVLRADLRRRRLSFGRAAGWNLATVLDVASSAANMATIAGLFIRLIPIAASRGAVPLDSPRTWAILVGIFVFVFLWDEGWRQIRFQRPAGIVFGEYLILAGSLGLLAAAIFGGRAELLHGTLAYSALSLAIVIGLVTIGVVVPRFTGRGEGHRILDRVASEGDSVQLEYTAPTPECPHPDQWHMVDPQSSELEVLDFLKSLVITLKPRLILETGTFLGHGALKMAEGLQANGFGRIITVEFDPEIFAKAQERIAASGLARWIESRSESSLESRVDGVIDLLFSDSHMDIREQEIRRFLPQLNPHGLILIHDASSHFRVVREAALRLEQEGLISIVLVPTPRGLVIAQKREGRK
ncbi:MAG: class I SAM-dependent methyltransferase [Candidatus Acidiferrales bacterium]